MTTSKKTTKKKKIDIHNLKVGDKVFAKIYLSQNYCYGAISEICKTSKNTDVYVSLCCEMSCRFELANIEDIVEEPTKFHWDLLNKAYKKH